MQPKIDGWASLRPLALLQPRRLAVGSGCGARCASDIAAGGFRRAFVVSSPQTLPLAGPLVAALEAAGIAVSVFSGAVREPTVESFEEALAAARSCRPDAVVGLGGGSALDVAKLVAVMLDARHAVRESYGIDRLPARRVHLACLPTTAGTGSEVSPNAVLLDERERMKRGIVSPQLVPDAAYVDPLLTLTASPAVTAAAGMDALTHCIEGYANRAAHPAVDVFALAGIRLIAAHLARAVTDGADLAARESLALGALYGGVCLGPVNTAAVHALAYPLGGRFRIPHGLANALLLPHVLEYNLPAAPERYADVALALGASPAASAPETARRGLDAIRQLSRSCGLTQGLADLDVPESAFPALARAAMEVTRLLENNPRRLTVEDAEGVYRAAHAPSPAS